MNKEKEKLLETWPAEWPEKQIPTSPLKPPLFDGDFELQVWPFDFRIPGEDRVPFYFRIKNPTQKSLEYEIVTKGTIHLHGAQKAVLEPMKISQPIGLYRERERDRMIDKVYIICHSEKDGVKKKTLFQPYFYFFPDIEPFVRQQYEDWKPVKCKGHCAIM